MGSVYGKPVNQKAVSKPDTSAYDAIQKLHKQVETINLSIKQKTTLANNYREKAKQCLINEKRDDARIFLEKKALLDKRVTQLIKMVSTLEHQINALESASINRDIVRAIEVSNVAIKNTSMSTDDVSNMMDNIREKIDDVNDVANILSEPLGDTIDVSDELSSLEIKHEVPTISMPVVPNIVHVVQPTIEDELRKLEVAN